MPIVTLYSDLVTKRYIVGADGFFTDQTRENSFSPVSHIQPNFTLQSGLYGQLNSLYFTLKGNFNYLNFSSDPRRIYEGSTYYDITQNGHYLWWSAAFEISYRF